MPSDLTDAQLKLLCDCYDRHEQHGFSTHIGQRYSLDMTDVVENEQHGDARALVRAGYAEWHPRPRPFSRAALRLIGTKRSPVRAFVDRQARIVPTPKGRARVEDHVKRSRAAKKAARTRKQA